jgi:hypothetical protein
MALVAASALGEAAAALVVSGPAAGVPGQELVVNIQLDTPLTGVDFDDLALILDFGAPLTGVDATEGALLAGSLFGANAPGGVATASFLSTQSDLGPGVLTTWKFKVDPNAVFGSTTTITPHLITSIIDDEETANLTGAAFSVQVVPEPSVNVAVIAGLLLLAVFRTVFAKAVTPHF